MKPKLRAITLVLLLLISCKQRLDISIIGRWKVYNPQTEHTFSKIIEFTKTQEIIRDTVTGAYATYNYTKQNNYIILKATYSKIIDTIIIQRITKDTILFTETRLNDNITMYFIKD